MAPGSPERLGRGLQPGVGRFRVERGPATAPVSVVVKEARLSGADIPGGEISVVGQDRGWSPALRLRG